MEIAGLCDIFAIKFGKQHQEELRLKTRKKKIATDKVLSSERVLELINVKLLFFLYTLISILGCGGCGGVTNVDRQLSRNLFLMLQSFYLQTFAKSRSSRVSMLNFSS